MRALETLVGTRVVALPDALDACIAELPSGMTALRFAPDEALLVGSGQIAIDDPDAIAERDTGYSAARLSNTEFARYVAPRIEWAIPDSRPCLVQGLVAGVATKILLADDHALVVCPTAFAHELAERLR